jgi:hypothetical protein
MFVRGDNVEPIDWRRDLAWPVALIGLLWAVTVSLLLLVWLTS